MGTYSCHVKTIDDYHRDWNKIYQEYRFNLIPEKVDLFIYANIDALKRDPQILSIFKADPLQQSSKILQDILDQTHAMGYGFSLTNKSALDSANLVAGIAETDQPQNIWFRTYDLLDDHPIRLKKELLSVYSFMPENQVPWAFLRYLPVLSWFQNPYRQSIHTIIGTSLFSGKREWVQSMVDSLTPIEPKEVRIPPQLSHWSGSIPEKAILWVTFNPPYEFIQTIIADFQKLHTDETKQKVFPLMNIPIIQLIQVVESIGQICIEVDSSSIQGSLLFKDEWITDIAHRTIETIHPLLVKALKKENSPPSLIELLDSMKIQRKGVFLQVSFTRFPSK